MYVEQHTSPAIIEPPRFACSHTSHLSLRNSPPQPNTTLSGIQPLLLELYSLWALLHDFLAFSQDQFDVARVGHVRVDLY